MDLSIVIPVYNEAENVRILYNELKEALSSLRENHGIKTYEIIFVDDGSRDNTFEILNKIQLQNNKVKIIKFRKNFGQTAALDAGFKYAKGNKIVSMDGDLQNDPADIFRLLAKLEEGYDVVSGWRYKRRDSIFKIFFSNYAQILRQFLVNDKIHDSGCTLRIYKKECLGDLDLYGDLHRFIPALLKWGGFKIGEIKIHHRRRKFGRTKYSTKRLVNGFLDLFIVYFWTQYSIKPIHFFGGLGLFFIFLGNLIGGYLIVLRFIFKEGIANRPLLLLVVILILGGIQFFMFGILADIMIKNIHNKKIPYKIEKIVQ